MQYDDEVRHLNLWGGLLVGAMLGTGIALLLAPQEQVRSLRRRTRNARSRKRPRWIPSLSGLTAAGRK